MISSHPARLRSAGASIQKKGWQLAVGAFVVPALTATFFSTAHAQTTEQLQTHYGDGDTATFRMESAWGGVLTYDNSGAETSVTGSWPITDGGVTCHINVTVGNAETVSVHCDGQYAPHVDVQGIPDGETFDFFISYLGG